MKTTQQIDENKTTGILCTCPWCGTRNKVFVKPSDYMRWELEGILVQAAFPYLSADERELIMTGICSPCWDKSFKECM